MNLLIDYLCMDIGVDSCHLQNISLFLCLVWFITLEKSSIEFLTDPLAVKTWTCYTNILFNCIIWSKFKIYFLNYLIFPKVL